MRIAVLKIMFGHAAMAAAVIFPLHIARAGDVGTDVPYFLTDELVDHTYALEFGQWKLVPTLSARLEHTDNVEEEPARKRDLMPSASASLELKGEIAGIDTSLTGSVYALRPLKTPSENDYEADIVLDLRRDFGDALRGRLKIEFADFRPGFSTDSLDHEQTIGIRPSLTYEIGKYEIEIRGNIGWDRFPGAVDEFGNPAIDSRQHKYAALELIASRDVSDRLALYVGALLRGALFDRRYDDNGYRRGSLGYGVFAGLRGDLRDDLVADIAVGVVRQTFADVDFPTRDYLSLNGSLQWKPTDRVRLTLLGDTGFSEGEDYGAAGILSYEATLRGEYKATDKVILVSEAGYERAEYLYADVVEHTYDVAVGLDYALSKHTALSMRYKYRVRRSDDPDETYDRNAIFAAIHFN